MSTRDVDQSIKPMGLMASVLYFGIPSLIVYASIYGLYPVFFRAGSDPMMAYLWATMLPLALMFAASFVILRVEGRSVTWAGVRERFRIKTMSGRDWLWTAGLTVFCLLTYGGLQAVEHSVVVSGVLPLPGNIPMPVDPRTPADIPTLKAMSGGQLAGNWMLLAVYFVVLFFNVIGEELWWRGVILPRQELAFGRWTWVIHGIMWCLFHAFKWWDYIALWPVTLAIAYLAQRRQNTTPGIIIHYIVNGLGWISTLLLVLGMIPS